jgi:hypothetical protein
MSVCPRCHTRSEPGEERCSACGSPLLELVMGPPAVPGYPETLDLESDGPENGARFILLLEEPLYEMAAMIREFLQNCGIGVLIHGEPISLFYRGPGSGADLSLSRVYVHESDFQEARELVAHFFHHA